MIRCKKNIPFIIIAIIICFIASLYIVAYFDSIMLDKTLVSYRILDVFKYVISKKITLQLYGCCIVIILLALGALWMCDTKGYQSDQMKITDTISTPVPAGQGQCGTAKWLPKDEYDKAFASYTFNEQDLADWRKMNLDDVKEELQKVK